MMDTILNLGLNDVAVEGLAAATGNPRFALDSYRRLIQMYGEVVDGIDGHLFEGELQALKEQRGVRPGRRADGRRPARADRDLPGDLRARGRARRFPQDPREQLRRGDPGRLRLVGVAAREGLPPHVRDPGRPRHRRERRPDGLRQQGRHVRAPASASRATRRRASGALYGEFLVNAQGEDVVAGIRTPEPIDAHARAPPGGLRRSSPRRSSGSRSTTARCRTSSSPSRTGALFLLQTRTGKRTAQAALRIAVEMAGEEPHLARGGGRADRSRASSTSSSIR